MTIEKQLDDLLVALWNDIANRQAGKIIFEDAKDIMQVRNGILEIFSTEPEDRKD
jgi:hypothetical protein